jgi:hypothetical protein
MAREADGPRYSARYDWSETAFSWMNIQESRELYSLLEICEKPADEYEVDTVEQAMEYAEFRICKDPVAARRGIIRSKFGGEF